MKTDYSIIIPIYNGELTIEKLVNKIITYFKKSNYSFQIILIYDWGKDNSWNIIKKVKTQYPKIIKIIKLTKNFGQHNALIAGIKYADSTFVITMDEDLQHNPFDIENLIIKQKENDYDVIYGKYTELKHSWFRKKTSKILKKILKFSIPNLHTDYSAFRLIKTKIAKETLQMNNSYSFLDGYLSWITTNIESVEVSHNKRFGGKSSYTLKKLIEHSINIFVTFSNIPIRILTSTSIFIFLITIIYSIIITYRYFVGQISIPGYTSLIISIGLGVGFILLGLGIIGEYIYRINLKTTKRPNYIANEYLK